MKREDIYEVLTKFAHDIRNPLQNIQLHSQLLERDLQGTDIAGTRIEKIIEAIREANRLVDELSILIRPQN
jgi:signal transduction histidine kinase